MGSDSLIEAVYAVGPRKIGRTNRGPVIYLGKELEPLVGRKALIIIQVLKEKEKTEMPIIVLRHDDT